MTGAVPMKHEVPALEYLSEDDCATFEGWLKFQAIDLSTLTNEDALAVRGMYDAAVERRDVARKVGRMWRSPVSADTRSPFATAMICG